MTKGDIEDVINAFKEEYSDGTIEEFKIWPREFDMGDGHGDACTVMIELASKYDHTDERYKAWARGFLKGSSTIEGLRERLKASSVVCGMAGQHRMYLEFYILDYER